MGTVTVGIDVGQRVDPTAICVAELEYRPHNGRQEDHWIIRYLERLPLGTPYPAVGERLTGLVAGVRRQAAQQGGSPLALTVYADATGVGLPVVDLLTAAGVPVHAVYFTHGDRRTQEGRAVSLGKAWLVSRLQALLQTGRLHLPKTAEATVLAKELQDYEIRVDEDANDRYGAFKVGTHDDLVTALGLAVQVEPRQWGLI